MLRFEIRKYDCRLILPAAYYDKICRQGQPHVKFLFIRDIEINTDSFLLRIYKDIED